MYPLHHLTLGTLEGLVRRYLGAFGPASARDIAAWAGYTAIGKAMESMPGELNEFRDEAGRVLYDLPKGMIVEDEAPIRFLPEYDNLVLSHADRSRILPDLYRKSVLVTAGRVCTTVLVDGFIAGAWKIERDKTAAALTIDMFAPLKKSVKTAIEAEGDVLLRCAAPEVPPYAIQLKI